MYAICVGAEGADFTVVVCGACGNEQQQRTDGANHVFSVPCNSTTGMKCVFGSEKSGCPDDMECKPLVPPNPGFECPGKCVKK